MLTAGASRTFRGAGLGRSPAQTGRPSVPLSVPPKSSSESRTNPHDTRHRAAPSLRLAPGRRPRRPQVGGPESAESGLTGAPPARPAPPRHFRPGRSPSTLLPSRSPLGRLCASASAAAAAASVAPVLPPLSLSPRPPPPPPPPGVSGGRYRAGPAPPPSLQPRARGRLGRRPAGRRATSGLRSRLVDVAQGSGEAAKAGGRGFAVPTINC